MEKSQHGVTDSEAPQTLVQPYVWQPGIRRTPWSALFALFVVLLCVPASAAILVVSNDRIADWKVQPSVLLGIVSGIGNSALAYALWKGVDISWWLAAFQGTTLEQLNRIWFCGTSVRSALFSIRHVRKIAIASILTAIVPIVVSPLLQKASRPTLLNVAQEVEMQIYLPTQLPSGFAGVAWDSDHPSLPGNTLLSPNFFLAIQTWYRGDAIITLPDPGFFCEGTCEGIVQGAGITADYRAPYSLGQSCSSSSRIVDMTEITTSGFPGFSTSFLRFEDSHGVTYLQVTASYISTVDDACSATYVTEICDIRLGINTYPVLYQNSTIFQNTYLSETVVETYTTTDDLSNAPFESPAGLLSGLHWFADTYLASNSNIVHGFDPSGNEMYIEIPSGFLSAQYLDLTNEFSGDTLNCQFNWNSPMVNITSALNSVAFRAASIAGWDRNETYLQTFNAVQTQPMVVYHSEYGFLAAAILVLLIALFAVSSTLYGFWQIGHDTSLSPLETAQALNAPILAGGSGTPTGNLKRLVTEIGKKEVKYGVVSSHGIDGTEVHKLGIGPPHLLVRHLGK